MNEKVYANLSKKYKPRSFSRSDLFLLLYVKNQSDFFGFTNECLRSAF